MIHGFPLSLLVRPREYDGADVSFRKEEAGDGMGSGSLFQGQNEGSLAAAANLFVGVLIHFSGNCKAGGRALRELSLTLLTTIPADSRRERFVARAPPAFDLR